MKVAPRRLSEAKILPWDAIWKVIMDWTVRYNEFINCIYKGNIYFTTGFYYYRWTLCTECKEIPPPNYKSFFTLSTIRMCGLLVPHTENFHLIWNHYIFVQSWDVHIWRIYLIDLFLAVYSQRCSSRITTIRNSIEKFGEIAVGFSGFFWAPFWKNLFQAFWNNTMLVTGNIDDVTTQWPQLF